MTPQDFIAKWRAADQKERSGSQSHFNDLCALLGVLDPIAADPVGEWFAFEKGASKTSGGEGWADVWRKGCFAWEYKGPRKDLDKAFSQLLQYSVALENPPLLIVSDMDRIRIHTNWTNTVQEVHDFTLEDLIDGDKREKLKRAFIDPEHFKPTKTRQALTEETAKEFAGIAQRLRDRGHEAHQVAHFVNQLVFCMFAEDVGLLPDNLFTKMLDLCRTDAASFAEHAGTLFGAMAKQGGKVGFTRIDWFNGGLFQDDHALPVNRDDVEDLFKAAQRDWSQIDPSILGTLFERGLDPAKRSQLGAHYTDREKIMLIVKPVIIDPLEAEWAKALAQMTAIIEQARRSLEASILSASSHKELDEEVKALRQVLLNKAQLELFQDLQEQKRVKALDGVRAEMRAASRQLVAAREEAASIYSAFVERLTKFRVLDPACGSGNFLYVALRSLKDIEHRANLDAEALGLPRGFPRVGPECVLGIELNPYAAELARVSVWIGEIQWMRRNGFDAAKNPILRNLDTIECRDAVLNEDGTRAEWPEADVVVGNPPFLGGSIMISGRPASKTSPAKEGLGETYTFALRGAWQELPGSIDLVCYWFAKAWEMIKSRRLNRAGLVATNSIRGGTNRDVLQSIVADGQIFDAWGDESWTVDGAAVRVSLISFAAASDEPVKLNGLLVPSIYADLTSSDEGIDLTKAHPLIQNFNTSFRGTQKGGPFDLSADDARRFLLIPTNVNGLKNKAVLHRRITGADLSRRPEDRWIIDFGHDVSEEDASYFEAPFTYVVEHVKPARDRNRREWRRLHYWLHSETSPGMREAIEPLSRYIGTPRVSKYRLFSWLSVTDSLDDGAIAIARDDDTSFGILHSSFHELWSLRMGTSLEDRPRYTPSTTFETFPFPEGLTPNIPAADYATDPRAIAIAAAAARLNELRENWLNPADLVVHEPEVVAGYPDRILPRDEAAAKELAKRTLTNLYNARPAWLDNAHKALDEAVAEAYGWGDDWRAGLLTEDEILARLFRLNQERAKV
jgi:type II restriction/modification system DNA methylase subunit YeeA